MDLNNKLWVFQSNRVLSSVEENQISEILSNFLDSWAAHGADLKSNLKILDHKFIIIEVDENQTKASGCSIDSLNQCIRQIDAEYNLELLNRLLVSFESKDGKLETIPMKQFKEKIKTSEIDGNSYVYNLSVSSPEEFQSQFKLPLKESWAKSYLTS
ncbi:hypothetical protein [Apibacter sp. HY039]|uniref:hypothetical protein n=1 Tax=Apibacter sp. HY039 TaxID=2501476 RepID=UPI000FEB686E|nr:hypothetical protein [Apibacter sp. HY039]